MMLKTGKILLFNHDNLGIIFEILEILIVNSFAINAKISNLINTQIINFLL